MTFLVTPDKTKTRGTLTAGGKTYACVLGKGGVSETKREGDGATPVGVMPLRRVFYRSDRIDPPKTHLPLEQISETMGWCDDPGDPAYNALVDLPFAASHEKLWRDDGVYDVVVELGYNDDPVIAGRGSAIFMHVAKPDLSPTEGCIALALDDLLGVLADADLESTVTVTRD